MRKSNRMEVFGKGTAKMQILIGDNFLLFLASRARRAEKPITGNYTGEVVDKEFF